MLKTQKKELVESEMRELTAPYQSDKLEFIKNPVVAEFLGFSQNTDFTESDLEKRILSNLQKFLMELGKGYAFVARQQHIHTEKQDYYIDLVFYNYILKCFVLIDLKTEKITHQDVGQIQKRPYLVIDKNSNCMCHGNSDCHMTICFKNKGNGSAFKIEPETEITASNGNTIIREEPIQDPIVMVNELCETKWKFDSLKRGFQFSVIVKFEDMSAQLYQQTFILILDNGLHIMVKNYAEPQLVSK